jgi:glycerate kinase
VRVGRRDVAAAGIAAAYSVADHVGGVERALAAPDEGLRTLAVRVARQWSSQRR